MNPRKLLGPATLTILAILSTTAATMAPAATIPNVLPGGTAENPVTATGKAATSTFGNGILELSSRSVLGSGSMNSLKLGSFTATFNEAESGLSGTKCTGLTNATEGQVTANGTFHIRDYKNGSALATALVALLAPVHFSCASILIVVSGCVAGALTPETKLTKTLTSTFAKTGADNTIITVLNEGDTANELCLLVSKEGADATKLSAFTDSTEISEFKQSGAAVEVLVMPL